MPGELPRCKTDGCPNTAWTRGTGETGTPRVAVSDECYTCAEGTLKVEVRSMGGAGCPECLWLIGHIPGCSKRPKTEREMGWNEAIEAAARFVGKGDGRDLWQPLGSQIDGMAADILKMKK